MGLNFKWGCVNFDQINPQLWMVFIKIHLKDLQFRLLVAKYVIQVIILLNQGLYAKDKNFPMKHHVTLN